MTGRARRISATATYGARRVRLGTRTVSRGRTGEFTGRLRIPKPRLWSPKRPYLYPVKITVSSGGRTVGTYSLKSGVRSLKVSRGRLYLNGRPVNFRGVGVHEDTRTQGFAVDNAFRGEARRRGAGARRHGAAHALPDAPLHPRAGRQDRAADLVGDPRLRGQDAATSSGSRCARSRPRRCAATSRRTSTTRRCSRGPSATSSPRGPGPCRATTSAGRAEIAKEIDPTRPTAIAFACYPAAGCQSEYAPLDIVGVNEYYGWYPGPGGKLFDRDGLGPYLDSVRRCYPRHAIVVTEFGAEANREGPVEEKGTFGYQQDFVNYHLGVFAQKPWLSGAIYWALNEFRVKPDWEGGNPRPEPPVHQKGLLTYDTMSRKPAWADVQRFYSGTNQYP